MALAWANFYCGAIPGGTNAPKSLAQAEKCRNFALSESRCSPDESPCRLGCFSRCSPTGSGDSHQGFMRRITLIFALVGLAMAVSDENEELVAARATIKGNEGIVSKGTVEDGT